MTKKTKKKITSENFIVDKFLIQLLRGAFHKTPMYSEAKNRAKEVYYVESKHGKQMKRVRYICAGCDRRFVPEPVFDKKGDPVIHKKGKRKGEHKEKLYLALDHIIPVVNISHGFTNILDWIKGLYCIGENNKVSLDNLQMLCSYSGIRDGKESCHNIKSAIEAGQRAETKRKKKDNK